MNTAIVWAKGHWYYIVGGLIGIFVLYELVHALSGSSSGASQSSDVSGGAGQLQALTAAADLTNAQVNGQTTVAEYGASVQNNQTAAALQLGEVKTAAELDATNHQTQASIDIARINAQAGVSAVQIATNGQVQETAIEGQTIDTLGAQKTAVQLQQVKNVNDQIMQIEQHSKHASQDYTAFAPIIAEETGQGYTAGALAQANAQSRVAGSQIATTAITSGADLLKSISSTVLTGLLA